MALSRIIALFNKSRVSEREASVQFLHYVLAGALENWSEITASFRDQMIDTSKLDLPWSQFEFGIAIATVQLRAVWNLCPSDQASRIHNHVIEILSSAPNTAKRSIEGLRAYDAAWQSAIDAGEPPFGALAITLCRRLDLRPPDIPNDGEFIDPLFLTSLGGAVTTGLPGWWKKFLGTHRLVA